MGALLTRDVGATFCVLGVRTRMSARPPGRRRAGRMDMVCSGLFPPGRLPRRQEQVTVPFEKFDVVVPELLVVV